MKKNIIDKIWDQHVVLQKEGHPAILGIDLHIIHEVTSPQGFQMLRERKLPYLEPERTVATVDHSIPTRENRFDILDQEAKSQVEQLRENVKTFNIPFFDMGSGNQGIVHVIGPELGLTQPGMTIVCGDSHTSTHGAFGALAFGIGSSEVGHVMATGCVLQDKPKTMNVEFIGRKKNMVSAKDMILKLIATIGISGANGHIIEYTGESIKEMSMEERMTLCNMSIECGARAGLIEADETCFEYLKGKPYAPKNEDWERALEEWRLFPSDEGAVFHKKVSIEMSDLEPMISWGTNPEQTIGITQKIPVLSQLPETHQKTAEKALEYTKLKEGSFLMGTPIQWAFLGSCTNGRLEDLRRAAKMLKGKKINNSVTMYIVPGSEQVKRQAEDLGLDKIFEEAGASWRNPGCSMCLGMNDDLVPSGQRCISTSNRNFVGRQGTGSITHLASPETVAASAITGMITDPRTSLI